MNKPLDGLIVLDLSQFVSGPRAAQILADMGAEVIKIEPAAGETLRMMLMLFPGGERMMSVLNRNKKCVSIDIRSEGGKTVFNKLAAKADILIENFVPGTMDKLGLGYKALSEINPGLIYAVISGYGLTGPYLQRPAFDLIAQAVAGIMDAQGNPDRPPGVMFADLVSGAYCALGVLVALIQRGKTGKGQIVDISMQEVMYSHHFQQLSDRALLPVKEMMDSFVGRSVIEMLTDWADPMFFWNSYRTKDGYVAIVALTERQWANLIKTAGKPGLATDERFSNIVGRIKNNRDVRGIVEEWTSSKTTAEIVETLNASGVPCGAVTKRSDLTNDHQLRDRGVFKDVNHPRFGLIEINANPIRLSGYPEPEYSAAPDIGANTIDVLARIAGLSQKELESLFSQGVIFTQT